MRYLIFLLAIFLVLPTLAVEVGPRQKWSMIGSVLKLSEDKEIMLFNKGFEDGIVEGDHAWFWSHEKKGFRAECLKTSESRSIWQIYRIENEDLVKSDIALRVRQATKPIYVTSPEDSDQL